MNAPKQKTGPGGAGVKSANSIILPRLLPIREVAELLGLKPGTVYGWIASRRIPFVRIRRSVRIPAAAVEALISENTVPAREVGR